MGATSRLGEEPTTKDDTPGLRCVDAGCEEMAETKTIWIYRLVCMAGLAATLAAGSETRAQGAPRAMGIPTCGVAGNGVTCSTTDSDSDGIIDAFDVCAMEAEMINGFEDGDGCPDGSQARLAELGKRILFSTGSSRLNDSSRSALEQMAARMKAQQQSSAAAVEVVGYADERGSETANRALSLQRARTAKNWLVARGVPSGIMVPIGAGALPGADAAVMKANRRVEVRARVARRMRVSGENEMPAMVLVSGWRTRVSEEGRAQVLDPGNMVYTVYSLMRTGPLWGIYGRAPTGAEVDLVLHKVPGEPGRVELRVRGAAKGPSTTGSQERAVSDRERVPRPLSVSRVREVRDVAVIGRTVFWTEACRRRRGKIVSAGRLMQASVRGENKGTLHRGGCPDAVAADDRNVYWSTEASTRFAGNARVMRRALKGGRVIPLVREAGQANDIEVLAKRLFWVDYNSGTRYRHKVVQVPTGGGQPTIVASAPYVCALSIGAGKVFWTTCGPAILGELDVSSGVTRTLVDIGTQPGVQRQIRGGTCVEGEVFFLVSLRSGDRESHELRKVGRTGSAVLARCSGTVEGVLSKAIAASPTHVYWARKLGSRQQLMRVRAAGDASPVAVSEGANVLHLAAGRTHLAWYQDGRIMSLAFLD